MTTTFDPTLFQHLATDYQRNMAVTAGAGTGKTEVLTRRIIKILGREEHYLGRLMVLTFTDKAAAEMKERIYLAIENELAQTGLPHFQKLKDTFLHNYISTFHSFCATLLREYPIEAGIDPYFRVLDETEKVFFLRRSINKSLRQLAAEKNDPDIRVLSEEFSRAVIVNCIFSIIQKREDTGAWIRRFIDLDWPAYRLRLAQYRACMLREICFKLYLSGLLQRHCRNLESMEAFLPDQDYAVNRKRVRAIRLLGLILEKLSLISEPDTAEKENGEMEDGHNLSEIEIDAQEIAELKEELLKTVRLSGSPPKAWPEEIYKTLKHTFTAIRYLLDSFPINDFEVVEEQEKGGFEMLKALARVARYCLRAYHDEKNDENYLDFQDLQLRIEHLLAEEKNRHILDEIRERFQYIMVDEFQDTNDLQWNIIKKIAADSSGQIVNPRVFVVGDEKQAIYSFRGGDVRLFSRVRQELIEANLKNGCHHHPFDLQLNYAKNYAAEYGVEMSDDTLARSGEIVFADNFRSAAVPVNFFNLFFNDLLTRDLYEEYDARPQLLRCSGNKTAGSIELLLVDSDTAKYDDAMDYVPEGADAIAKGRDSIATDGQIELKPHFKEALLIADKIKEVFLGDDQKYQRVRENARKGRPAVAILLNRRTMIKTYEEALRLNRISFTVVRGRGFFQRQEIVDVGNLLTLLTDRENDFALTAFLRSPLGHLSDEGIFLLFQTIAGATHWEKLQNCAAFITEGKDSLSTANSSSVNGGYTTFSAEDRRAIVNAARNLTRWFILSRRMPLVDFLRLVFSDSGSYASLCRGNRGEQAISNLEKLMDSAREIALQDGGDLPAFTEWLNNRIDFIEEEGEADVDISLGGSVQIMTVHQSKGLEFPMVFVPDLGANFNLGDRELLYTDQVPYAMSITGDRIIRRELTEIGIDAPNPENQWESEPILIKRIIKKRLRDKLIAEKKRLFYVACTRAMDHLVLVGHANFKSERLIRRITYLPLDLLNNWMEWLNQILGITFNKKGLRGKIHYTNQAGQAMEIPYRMFLDEASLTGLETVYRTHFPIAP